MYYKLLAGGYLLFLVAGMGQPGLAQGGSHKTASIRPVPAAGSSGQGKAGRTGTEQPGPGLTEDSLFLRRLAEEILVNGKAYSNLRTLTRTVGGRLAGSPQYYQAEAWGQKALQDAGADKVWLQECMVPHWVRGGKDSASWITVSAGTGNGPAADSAAATGSKGTGDVIVMTYDTRRRIGLDILALGNSLGTGPKGIEAPVVLIHSFEELEQRKNEIKGKIVFYNYPFNPRFVETFRAYGDAVRYRALGPSRAARYGAVGVLVRSMTHSVDNIPHTGATIYNDSFPKIPAAAVGLWDADKLAAALESKSSGEAKAGAGGKTGSEEIRIYLRTLARMLPDTVAHNVIGEIRGSEFPDEFITVGGHLDSWDVGEGAQDDGAGCVHSIEVLRALKAIGYKPLHSIRVVLFANEENGGRGGEKYAEEARANHEKQLFGLESDAGGFTPRAFSLSLSEEKLAAIRPWLRLLQPYGVYAFEHGGGGADVTPLEGMPGAVVGELIPDSQRYFDYHHSRSDVLANVNKRELELGALNMAALIYLVDKHGWTPSAP